MITTHVKIYIWVKSGYGSHNRPWIYWILGNHIANKFLNLYKAIAYEFQSIIQGPKSVTGMNSDAKSV